MQRIFRQDGRSLIVAMDHGSGLHVLPEMADPGKILDDIRGAGADAVLTTMGIATTFAENIGAMGLILRIDGAGSALDQNLDFRQRYTVEEALRIGADGVGCMGFPGVNGGKTLDGLARLAGQCQSWRVPLLAEMLPGAFDGSFHSTENVALASRIGAELGADIIKTTFTGDAESFRSVSSGVFCPVVVLGGTRKESDVELLKMVRAALDGGAAGVAVGRNIWKHDNVHGITRALVRVIHDDASVEEALEELTALA